ncbi:MAG: hypothetical protein ACWGSQ_20705, partial [Longimicrobiales bacterium]
MRKPLAWSVPVALSCSLAAVALSPISVSPSGGHGLQAQLTTPLDSTTLAAFRWRPVGPANMSGRVTD